MSNPYAAFATPTKRDQGDQSNPYAGIATRSTPAAPAAQGEEMPGFWDAVGYSAADAASLGFGDELAGAAEGVGAMMQGEDYLSAYRERVDAARARLEMARAARPGASLLGSVIGSAPLVVPFGAASRALPMAARLTEIAGSRGLPAVAAQVALGAAGGVAGGYAYGVGSSDGDVGERLTDGVGPAAIGGVFGALAPVTLTPALRGVEDAVMAAPGVRPVMNRARDALSKLTSRAATTAEADLAQDATRMSGRVYGDPGDPMAAMDVNGPPPPPAAPPQDLPPPNIPQSAVKDIDRLMGREQMDVAGLEQAVSQAEARPMGRTLADIGGQQFLAKADALANAPGRAGPRAEQMLETRASELPSQIADDLQTRLKVNKSPDEALKALEDGMENIGKEYRALFARQRPRKEIVERNIIPLIENDPLFEDALERTYRIQQRQIRLAKRRGRPQPRPDIYRDPETRKWKLDPDASGETLHRLKIAFDDAVGAGRKRTDASSIEKFEALEVAGKGEDSLRSIFLRDLDEAIPGYYDVRKTFGGYAEAQEALDLGAKALERRPAQVRSEMVGMTPFEKKNYRIAVADAVIKKVMRGASAVGNRNAANSVNNLEIQNILREVFESPEQAEAFLMALNERNQLLRNAAGMAGNSKTAQRLMQQGDQMAATMADAGVDVATGNPGAAASKIGWGSWNAIRGGALEKRNNALADVILREIDDGTPETKALMKELLRQLRDMEEARLRRGAAAAPDGAINAQIGQDLAGDVFGEPGY